MTKKTKTVLIIMGAVIAILAAVIIVMALRGKKDTPAQTPEEPEKRSTLITEDNADEVLEEMGNREYVEPGYYNVRMNTEWHYKTGDAESEDSYVANSDMNTNDVYFDVVLAEDESQVLYKSPIIPVGKDINNIKLDKKLDAGTHECVMIYHLVDDKQETLSTLRVTLNIIVEK
ncbi:MAG: hypothetical protein IJT37_02300 [Lachnospiraceae bacterium]|nr:hypothetical protein [Lachnospiraceae bacterium]